MPHMPAGFSGKHSEDWEETSMEDIMETTVQPTAQPVEFWKPSTVKPSEQPTAQPVEFWAPTPTEASTYPWATETTEPFSGSEEPLVCANIPGWDANWGTCDTYAPDKLNHDYCQWDQTQGKYANWGTCDTYA